MNNQDLYKLWIEANRQSGIEVEEPDMLTRKELGVWANLADLVNAEIEDAVVEVLPGTKAGERTDF